MSVELVMKRFKSPLITDISPMHYWKTNQIHFSVVFRLSCLKEWQ